MAIDAKLSNNFFCKLNQQYIERIVHYCHVRSILGYKDGSIYAK